MELHRVEASRRVLGRGEHLAGLPEEGEPGRKLLHEVAVARPDAALGGHTLEKASLREPRQRRFAVFAMRARADRSAEIAREELHAVAHAEDRNPRGE